MSDLELILPTNKKLSFSLGDSPEFLAEFEEPEEIDADKEMNRVYWIYRKKYGMDFLFENNKLTNLFLYKKCSEYMGFSGSFSLLPIEYFNNYNKEEFVDHLKRKGFIAHPKKYPFSLDMIDDNYRLRYHERPDNFYISFNNGNLIRDTLKKED